MDRRTFVLLTGTVSSGLIRAPQARRAPGLGRLRFELDDRRRWSLWYYGDGAPVPLIRDAEVVTWLADRALGLADLEDSTVGTRRPPGGDAVVVRGLAAGGWVEAEFLTAVAAQAPQAIVTVTVFPDRLLPSVKGIRFFQLPESGVLGGPGPLVALVNGYHSSDPCRVVAVGAPEAAGLASHGALGLARAGRGLAIAFDAGEPGEARVHLGPEALEAASQWLPTRPLRPEGDASRMRLAFDPQGDGLTALRALFVPSSPVDQDRLAQAAAPAGWCSRQALGRCDLRARRGASQGTAVAVRPGPRRGARLGLRLCQNRRPPLGHARNGALRGPDARGSIPRRAGRDSRWTRHRGVPRGERGPAAARRRTRERDADRPGRC